MVYKCFDKRTSSGAATLANKSAIKSENISNKELTEELHKPIIGKFNNRKVHSPFIDNIWSAYGADIQLISKLNKEFRFLLPAIYIYDNKYTWVIPLKDKKWITIIDAFHKILNESNHKPNQIWVDKDSEFYNRSIKSQPEKNAIKRKSVVAGRFIRKLQNKSYKYITSVSKNIYISKLDDIDNKYNNAYYNTIKMKPKYKNIFAKS